MAKANSTRVRKQTTTAPKCRKGDLAILLFGPCAGYIVDVVEYYGTVAMDNGEVLVNAWHIRHSSDDVDTEYFREDKHLSPIRPGDLDENEIDELSLVKGETS